MPWVRSAWGRLRQVAWYLSARPSVAEEAWALRQLPPALHPGFRAMGPADRAHVVRVARRLEAQGAPPWVVEAALLHDLAKPAEVGLAGRVAHVALAPLDQVWPAWRSEAMRRFAEHEVASCRAAEAGGASPEAVALLRHLMGEGLAPAPGWVEAFVAADEAG